MHSSITDLESRIIKLFSKDESLSFILELTSLKINNKIVCLEYLLIENVKKHYILKEGTNAIILGYTKGTLSERLKKFFENKNETYPIKSLEEYYEEILNYFLKRNINSIYIVEYGPAGIRTPDLQLRRLSPYPD